MSQQKDFPKVSILGIEIDNLSIDEATAYIASQALKPGPAKYIVKPYVEFFSKESENPEFMRLLNKAFMCLPDGVALKWAAHFLNHTRRRFIDVVVTGLSLIFRPHHTSTVLKGYFGGTNFTWELMRVCAQRGCRIFLVGSPQARTIEHTKSFLENNIPGLQVVGIQSGRDAQTGVYSAQLEEELVKILNESKPDIVLFGLNFQTYIPLMAGLITKIPHGVLIGEGGTFDYRVFGGHKKKSPAFIQRMGLEWFWRLLLEPRRIKRQMAIPYFIWKVYRSARKQN